MNPRSVQVFESCRRAVSVRTCNHCIVGRRYLSISTGPFGTVNFPVPADSSSSSQTGLSLRGTNKTTSTVDEIQPNTSSVRKSSSNKAKINSVSKSKTRFETAKANKSNKQDITANSQSPKPLDLQQDAVQLATKPCSLAMKSSGSEHIIVTCSTQAKLDDEATQIDLTDGIGEASELDTSASPNSRFTAHSTTAASLAKSTCKAIRERGDGAAKNRNSRRRRSIDIMQESHTITSKYVTHGDLLEIPVNNYGAQMYRTLPLLNASALFQQEEQALLHDNHSPLTMNSSTKEELVQVIREATIPKRRRAFIMTGHGVPHQLLQDHLNMADSLLHQEHAHQCLFNNFLDHRAVKDWILVRSREGINRPSQVPSELHHSLDLYLTVMDRLAKHLALVFLDEPRKPSHWTVEFQRQMAFKPQLVRQDRTGEPLSPIVEWVARSGINAPGQVIITLQGFGDVHSSNGVAEQHQSLRHRRLKQVSMVFEAGFRKMV